MIRRLPFTDRHKLYFRLVYAAFTSRGSATQDARFSKEDHRLERGIVKSLKAISEPIGDAPHEDEPDVRNRRLIAGGGVLEVSQPEFARLQKYLADAQWSSQVTDLSEALQEWFDTAEKIDA